MKTKIAYGEWAFPIHGPVGMKMAAEVGFDGVHLTDYGGNQNGFLMNHPKIQEEYLNAAAKYNLEIDGYHLYSLSLQGFMTEPADSAKGVLARQILEKGVEVCRKMNVPNLMLSAGGPAGVSAPNNPWKKKNFLDHLAYLCDITQGTGIAVTFESVMSPKKIHAILEAVQYRARVCYDVLNPIWISCDEPLEEIPEIGIEHIGLVHLKDAPENYQGKCTLGTGPNHIDQTLQLLKNLGYNGWYVAENYYSEHNGLDPFKAAARDVEAVRRILA